MDTAPGLVFLGWTFYATMWLIGRVLGFVLALFIIGYLIGGFLHFAELGNP